MANAIMGGKAMADGWEGFVAILDAKPMILAAHVYTYVILLCIQLNTSLKEEIKAGVGRFNEFRDGEMVMTMLEDEEDKFPRAKKKRPRKRKVSSI